MQVPWRLLLLVSVLSAPAWAYPWMVKHNYGSCAACHVDPSGAGQLTPYGRAQADVLVRWKLNPPPKDQEPEVPASANFLWFLELPEWLNLSGNLRSGALLRPTSSTPFIPLGMAYDLYVTLAFDRFLAHATTGVGLKNAQQAAVLPVCEPSVTGSCGVQWLAREFWLGAKFAEEAVMVRAGRMNLPFGLRNNEHTSWVRALTRTDTNLAQQVGAALAYNSELLRGELMGIAGNFQVGPDVYRERGYSAFGEYALRPNATLGVSSLIAHAAADLATGRPTTRHAHGLFVRVAPTEKLALLGEADFLAWQTAGTLDRLGFAALLQGDLELTQGLHLMATAEGAHTGAGERGPSLGGWLSAAWYPLPHFELRLDNILRRRAQAGGEGTLEYSLLLQLHVFL